MQTRFYIASALSNKSNVSYLADSLEAFYDWKCTYRWFDVGEVAFEDYPKIAAHELEGVLNCDAFILLCPGKFGSHTELGAALADPRRRVIIAGASEHIVKLSSEKYPSIFYYHRRVTLINTDQLELPLLRRQIKKEIDGTF